MNFSFFDIFSTAIVVNYDTAEIHEIVYFLQCSGSDSLSVVAKLLNSDVMDKCIIYFFRICLLKLLRVVYFWVSQLRNNRDIYKGGMNCLEWIHRKLDFTTISVNSKLQFMLMQMFLVALLSCFSDPQSLVSHIFTSSMYFSSA